MLVFCLVCASGMMSRASFDSELKKWLLKESRSKLIALMVPLDLS